MMSDSNEEVIEEESPETQEPEEQPTDINPLSMSDEDIEKMDIDSLPPLPEEKEEESIEQEEEEEPAEAKAEAEAKAGEKDVFTEEKRSPKEETESEDKVDKEIEEAPDAVAAIDYETEYKKLTAPFRANGKEMQVNSVDDAIKLMQMGSNYTKKMTGLKPSLKILKMLERENLLDEEKLSYLIDLDKQNPGAIAKLVGDSGVDPLDIDTDKGKEYKPNTYTVDNREVELDQVLDDIKDTPTFDKTIDVISNKWDDSSKKILADNPKIIQAVNEHIQLGYYEPIMNIVEQERMVGRLAGLSDLEAYKMVGDAIESQGGFAQQQPVVEQQPEPINTQPQPKRKQEDPTLKSRKRAASPTKGTGTAAVQAYNPLAMSDEEFEKLTANIPL